MNNHMNHNSNQLNKSLDVNNLVATFPVYKGTVFKKKIGEIKVVDDVSFHIHKGKTLGLVGESGCGKTTIGRTILLLNRPSSGEIIFEGTAINQLKQKQLRPIRKRMQMIFQDPYASIDPRMRSGDIVGEPLLIHKLTQTKKEYHETIAQLFDMVGLNPRMIDRYPHEFSGGQRQRIVIARALSVQPELIICDEPVSSLDVSIQAQIINLLEDLQEKFQLTYLFIAHDLAVVRHISDTIAVMYMGNIIEIANRMELYHNPLHPYTKALLASVPIPDPEVEANRVHINIKGEISSLMNPPTGCKFHPRCPHVKAKCKTIVPTFKSYSVDYSQNESKNETDDHRVACHYV